MQIIPLESTANQQFSVRIDNVLFEITLKVAEPFMLASISRDGVPVVQGVRCTPNMPLMPYNHLEGGTGNFYFITGGEYPHYTSFGATHQLCYLTAAELVTMRGALHG